MADQSVLLFSGLFWASTKNERGNPSRNGNPKSPACSHRRLNSKLERFWGFGSVSPRKPSPISASNPHPPPKHSAAFSSPTRCRLTKGVCLGDHEQGRCKGKSLGNRFGLVLLFRRSPCRKFPLRSTVPAPLSALQSALLGTWARSMAMAGVLKQAHAAASASQALTARSTTPLQFPAAP